MGDEDLDSLVAKEILKQGLLVLHLELGQIDLVTNFRILQMVDFDSSRFDVLQLREDFPLPQYPLHIIDVLHKKAQ